MDTILIDTGVLVYAYDRVGPEKQRRAGTRLSFWAAARLNQVGIVFSEGFVPVVVEGVRFVNPFADDFRAEEWGL